MDSSSGSSHGGAYQEGPVAPGLQVPPGADMINGDITDGEPSLHVYIPRRAILAEVGEQTGLAIHEYGSVTDKNGLVKAWVVADLPRMPGRPQETHAFHGERKGDLDSAEESAAELALCHLCAEYGIVINDYNYSALVECREKLLIALERERKMEAEFEAVQKKVIRKKQQHDKLIQALKDFCLKFADILHVRAAGPSGIEYVGPPSPTRELDQFAAALVQLIHQCE